MAAFYLASTNGVQWNKFVFTTLGVFFVSFGSCVFNQIFEMQLDQKMHRTQNRPLPTHRVLLPHAWVLGSLTTVVGLLIMLIFVNAPSLMWLLLAWVGYVGIYTPLKVKTTLNTIVGAVVGALPPIVGWVAARSHLSFEAVILFLIMFFWQLPHFLSISWLYRDDYKRANMKMITSLDPEGVITPRQSFLYTIMLLPIVMLPTVFSMTGYVYLIVAILMTLLFVYVVVDFWKETSQAKAKLVLLSSVIYLPTIFVVMVVDKVGV